MLIKIDRVPDIDTAEALLAAGVDIISMDIGPDRRFRNARTVPIKMLTELATRVDRSRISAAFDPNDIDEELLRELVAKECCHSLSVPLSADPSHHLQALSVAGYRIFGPRVDVTHDDDPAWVASSLEPW